MIPISNITIRLNHFMLMFSSASSSQTISLKTNGNWTVSVPQSWIKISKKSGKGATDLTVTLDANTNDSKRFSAITLSCEGGSCKVYISQEAYTTYSYVDLGLSVKWATCNVGANAPEEYGGYFAWGETTEKSEYNEYTYKWYDASTNTLTTYDSDILDKDDDVAHVKWGGAWRMPTREELEELYTQCSWTWTFLNNKRGYKVTGPNGNSIFLPAAGYYYDTSIRSTYSIGSYWSSSISYYEVAFYLEFDFEGTKLDRNNIYRGRSVRPVCP